MTAGAAFVHPNSSLRSQCIFGGEKEGMEKILTRGQMGLLKTFSLLKRFKKKSEPNLPPLHQETTTLLGTLEAALPDLPLRLTRLLLTISKFSEHIYSMYKLP